jgi:hypothetical protein
VQGMALLHLHGAKCMLHEARVAKKNAKYVLRSDVLSLFLNYCHR